MFIAEREIVASVGDAADSAVYLVAGGPRLAGDIDATTAPGITTFSGFGLHGVGSVGLGNLDEDGLDDVALTGWAGGAGLAGGDVAAFFFYGRPDGFGSSVLVTSPDVILRVPIDRDPDDLEAMSIDAADLDGDGHRDILVGDTSDRRLPGRSASHHRHRRAMDRRLPPRRHRDDLPRLRADPVLHHRVRRDLSGPRSAGADVAGGGDVDGDGKADMIVGAPGSDFSFGRAYILR